MQATGKRSPSFSRPTPTGEIISKVIGMAIREVCAAIVKQSWPLPTGVPTTISGSELRPSTTLPPCRMVDGIRSAIMSLAPLVFTRAAFKVGEVAWSSVVPWSHASCLILHVACLIAYIKAGAPLSAPDLFEQHALWIKGAWRVWGQ